LFETTAFLFPLKKGQWWMIAGPAVILSQSVIFLSLNNAKFGTPVNVIIPLGVSFLNAQPSSFRNRCKTEVFNGLHRQSDFPLVSEGDIRHLPKSVRKYL
jgi:hypothetical protein